MKVELKAPKAETISASHITKAYVQGDRRERRRIEEYGRLRAIFFCPQGGPLPPGFGIRATCIVIYAKVCTLVVEEH